MHRSPPPDGSSALAMNQNPCHFNRLPSELRNEIYKMVLQTDTEANGPLELMKMYRSRSQCRFNTIVSHAAKSLSQVSRAIRTDYMGIYYADNTFRVTLTHLGTRRSHISLERQHEWAKLALGQLAIPHLRRLNIVHDNIRCSGAISIDLMNAVQPLTSRVQASKCSISRQFDLVELNTLVLAILWPRGRLVLTPESLMHLFSALQLIRHSFRRLTPRAKAYDLSTLIDLASVKRRLRRFEDYSR